MALVAEAGHPRGPLRRAQISPLEEQAEQRAQILASELPCPVPWGEAPHGSVQRACRIESSASPGEPLGPVLAAYDVLRKLDVSKTNATDPPISCKPV